MTPILVLLIMMFIQIGFGIIWSILKYKKNTKNSGSLESEVEFLEKKINELNKYNSKLEKKVTSQLDSLNKFVEASKTQTVKYVNPKIEELEDKPHLFTYRGSIVKNLKIMEEDLKSLSNGGRCKVELTVKVIGGWKAHLMKTWTCPKTEHRYDILSEHIKISPYRGTADQIISEIKGVC